jgi:hypothetical protein
MKVHGTDFSRNSVAATVEKVPLIALLRQAFGTCGAELLPNIALDTSELIYGRLLVIFQHGGPPVVVMKPASIMLIAEG